MAIGRKVLNHIFQNFVGFFIGIIACQYLYILVELPAYLASAVVGLLGSFLVSRYFDLSASIFTGSFFGMSPLLVETKLIAFLFASMIGAFLLQYFPKKFDGVGGRLGTIAFIAFVFSRLIEPLL